MVLIVIGAIVIGTVLIYIWIKAVNAIFNPLIKRTERKRQRKLKNDNPYIVAHKMKFENDAMYDEYLNWLNQNGGDIPFDKWKTQEEIHFERQLNS